MQIRLVSLDLDGTLIDSTGSIGPVTQQALLMARESGVYIVIATGRALRSALPACEPVRPHFIIASHGATLLDMSTRAILWAKTIPGSLIRGIIQLISAFDVWPRVHTLDEVFIARRDLDKGDLYSRAYGEKCHLSPDRASLAREAIMLGVAGPPEAISPARRKVEDAVEGLASVHQGNAESFDVVAYNASKLAALTALAGMLKVDRGHIAAFGDGLNDTELLAWAGVGMAVEGAPDQVLKAASGRTVPRRDGVGTALLELLRSP